jgi:4-amino-4-deoxy-L-arabinose transferase-like glycosyltransferase
MASVLKTHQDSIFLCIISGMALLQMAYEITLPGLYYDEAYHAVYGVMILTGRTILFGTMAYGIWSFQRFPILTAVSAPYVGPLQGYLALVSMFFFGINATALRIFPILFTAASLPLLFLFVKKRFGTCAAYFATLIAAFQPSLLLYSRLGFDTSSMLVFFICSSLYCFDRWLSFRQTSALAIGFLLLGLGLEVHLMFAWYIIALAMTTVIFRIHIHLRKRNIPIILASFVAALGPYVIPWMTGEVPDYVLHFARTSSLGIDNLAYTDHLLLRLSELAGLVDGSAGTVGVEVVGVNHNPLAIPILLGSIVGIALLATAGRRMGDGTGRTGLWLITMFVLIFVQSPFTIHSFNTLHLILLLPFSFMIVGCFAGTVFHSNDILLRGPSYRESRVGVRVCKTVLLLVLSCSVLIDVSNTVRYYTTLEQTGGWGPWSDAIYQAADYLTRSSCSVVLATDWGLSFPLLVSSGGKLNVRDSEYGQDQMFQAEVNNWVGSVGVHRVCFVSYASQWRNSYGPPNRLDLIGDMARRMNATLILEKIFYQRDLTPVIDVYRIYL